MPRSVLALLMALAVLVAAPAALRAAEPETAPFVEAATAAGLDCDEYAPSQFLCFLQTDERYWYSNIDILGGDLSLTVGRIVPGDVQEPVEAEVLGLMRAYVRLLVGDDSGASPWLDGMNTGPQSSGQLQLSDAFLSWSSHPGEVVLDISLLPNPDASSPVPIPNADWAAEGTSTYAGTWTVTVFESDFEIMFPDHAVGDTAPGMLVIECESGASACDMKVHRDGRLINVGRAATRRRRRARAHRGDTTRRVWGGVSDDRNGGRRVRRGWRQRRLMRKRTSRGPARTRAASTSSRSTKRGPSRAS